MKLKRLFAMVTIVVLSAVMGLALTACSGGGSAEKYTVKLDTNGGTIAGDTSISVTYDEAYSFNTPTKTGYVFNGWVLNDTTVEGSGVWQIKENVTLKADWVAKTYTLTLDYAGGSGSSTTSITVTYGKAVSGVPTNLTKTGYTFSGWKLNDSAFNTNSWTLDSNATIVAQWTAKKYDVTVDVNGGDAIEIPYVTASYGSPIPNLPALTRTGYELTGWKLNGSDYTNQNYQIEGNATIQAQWTPKTYNVTFNLDGGTADSTSTTVVYDALLTGVPTPTKTGYTHNGWTVNGTALDLTAVWKYAEDTTIEAVWSANEYTVTIDVNGGDALTPNTIKVAYGQPIKNFLPVLNKAGEQVSGWKIGTEDLDVDAPWLIANDTTTIIAQWKVAVTNVTFDVNGGDAVEPTSANVTYGQVLVVPTTMTREGYTFSKWTLNDEDYDVTSNWALEDETATLVAVWTANTYQVTFNVNGGEPIATTVYTATFDDALFEANEVPTTTKDNYTFVGWEYDGEVVDLTAGWTIADNVTLVAKWQGNESVVTLKYNVSGMGEEEVFVYFGEEYDLVKTCPGYTVDYWVKEGTEERVDATGVWAIEGNVTLVPEWKATSYTVRVKDHTGKIIETVENAVTFGEAYDLTRFIPANDKIVIESIGEKFFSYFVIDEADVMVGHNSDGEVYDLDYSGDAWLGTRFAVDGNVITLTLIYDSYGTWY